MAFLGCLILAFAISVIWVHEMTPSKKKRIWPPQFFCAKCGEFHPLPDPCRPQEVR